MLAYLSMYWSAAKLHYGIMAVMAIISALFLLLIKILGGAEEEETSGNFGTAKMADSKYLKSENVVLGRSPTQRKRTIDPINCQIAYGKFQGKYIGSDDIEPQLVIAPQREGKTATICIPFLLDCPFNVFALDQKGELFLTTYKQREALGKKPMVLDPFNILDQFGDFEKYKIKGFNPLDVKLDSDIDRERYVLALCDALIMFESANASDNHFTDAAYGIMRGLLDGFLNQGYSMKHVYDRIVLQPGKEFVGILKDINNDLKSRFLLTGIAYLEKAGDKERGSMETTILRCFDWLAGGTMANFFDQGRFPVEQFVEGNSDIFLVLPPDMIKRYSRVVRLVISTAGSKILRTPVSKLHKRYPFLIDEIAQLKYFPYIEEMIEVGGGYGIRIIAIFQTLSQVREHKKADLFENMQVKHFFATTDMKTMDWIKRLGGTKTIKNISSSESTNQKRKFLSSPENLGTSTSEQEVGATLIHDDQITTMPVDEKWLFISKKRPIKCKKIYYFEDPRYAGKYQDNPIETR